MECVGKSGLRMGLKGERAAAATDAFAFVEGMMRETRPTYMGLVEVYGGLAIKWAIGRWLNGFGYGCRFLPGTLGAGCRRGGGVVLAWDTRRVSTIGGEPVA